MQNTMQEFHWQEFCHQDTENQRSHYKGFMLNEAEYLVGDCVSLFPENLGEALYVGRIVSAFVDSSVAGDAHCIEVSSSSRSVSRQLFFSLPSVVGAMVRALHQPLPFCQGRTVRAGVGRTRGCGAQSNRVPCGQNQHHPRQIL